MTTSQAFRNALHVPRTDPALGEMVVVITAGADYVSDWEKATGSGGGDIISFDLGTGASIGAAWTTLGADVSISDVVFADFNSQKYARTGPGSADADWWPLEANLIDCGTY